MGKYRQAMMSMSNVRVGAQAGTAGTSLEDFQKQELAPQRKLQTILKATEGNTRHCFSLIFIDIYIYIIYLRACGYTLRKLAEPYRTRKHSEIRTPPEA